MTTMRRKVAALRTEHETLLNTKFEAEQHLTSFQKIVDALSVDVRTQEDHLRQLAIRHSSSKTESLVAHVQTKLTKQRELLLVVQGSTEGHMAQHEQRRRTHKKALEMLQQTRNELVMQQALLAAQVQEHERQVRMAREHDTFAAGIDKERDAQWRTWQLDQRTKDLTDIRSTIDQHNSIHERAFEAEKEAYDSKIEGKESEMKELVKCCIENEVRNECAQSSLNRIHTSLLRVEATKRKMQQTEAETSAVSIAIEGLAVDTLRTKLESCSDTEQVLQARVLDRERQIDASILGLSKSVDALRAKHSEARKASSDLHNSYANTHDARRSHEIELEKLQRNHERESEDLRRATAKGDDILATLAREVNNASQKLQNERRTSDLLDAELERLREFVATERRNEARLRDFAQDVVSRISAS